MYGPRTGGFPDNSLRDLFNRGGFVVLFLLLSQNLLRLPFFLLRSYSYRLWGHGLSAFSTQLSSVAVYLASTGLTIIVGLYLLRCDHNFVFPMAPVRRDYLLPALGAGLGAAMVGNLAATLLEAGLNLGHVYSRANVPSFAGGLPTVLLTLAGATVLPALLEELLFRGVLLQPLRRYGDGLAVAVSAVAFALCHPTLPQAVNALVMGLVLGVFAVRSGSLALPMVIHFVYNSLSCVFSMAAVYDPGGLAALLSWGVVLVLLGVGIYCILLLRRRFGPVWRLPRQGSGSRYLWRSLGTSVPALAAAALCLAAIISNLYRL